MPNLHPQEHIVKLAEHCHGPKSYTDLYLFAHISEDLLLAAKFESLLIVTISREAKLPKLEQRHAHAADLIRLMQCGDVYASDLHLPYGLTIVSEASRKG